MRATLLGLLERRRRNEANYTIYGIQQVLSEMMCLIGLCGPWEDRNAH